MFHQFGSSFDESFFYKFMLNDKEGFGNFLKKEKYTGSCNGMRFRMEKFEKEGEETPVLRVSVWPEPYSFDCTPEEEKQFLECTFDADGIAKGADWINERYEAELPRWKKVTRL